MGGPSIRPAPTPGVANRTSICRAAPSSARHAAGTLPFMQTPPRNFAARAGRWSARHRKIAIFGWLAFVAVMAVGGGAAGLNTFVWQENGPGEAGRADKAIFD